MNPDDLKDAWRAQDSRSRLPIDVELLLKEVRRNDRQFAAMIFWRDVREVGVGLAMVPLLVFLGVRNSSPWTYYLTVPVVLWVAGFMLVGRVRHGQRSNDPGESLRRCVEGSLAQVEHQVWLLRNVHLWALLPLALAMLAFFSQVAWENRSGGWWTALAVSEVVALGAGVLGGVYWLNRYAVRHELEPRRRELEALLRSLDGEPSDAG